MIRLRGNGGSEARATRSGYIHDVGVVAADTIIPTLIPVPIAIARAGRADFLGGEVMPLPDDVAQVGIARSRGPGIAVG